MFPNPSPTCPSPAVKELREVVAVRGPHVTVLEVVSANGNDPIVVTVSTQQLLTEVEKRRIGQTIVLENDRLLEVVKDPLEPADDPQWRAFTRLASLRLGVSSAGRRRSRVRYAAWLGRFSGTRAELPRVA